MVTVQRALADAYVGGHAVDGAPEAPVLVEAGERGIQNHGLSLFPDQCREGALGHCDVVSPFDLREELRTCVEGGADCKITGGGTAKSCYDYEVTPDDASQQENKRESTSRSQVAALVVACTFQRACGEPNRFSACGRG